MLHTGLVSVTFRELSPREIVSLVSAAGLEAVEWGGDIHVPHGNLERAREVGELTRAAGLKVASYGSYYRVGVSSDFPAVLETARELGAPAVRIWAGDRGTDQADEAWWDQAVRDARRIAAMARKANVRLSFEYHRNTLTDCPESAVRLLQEAGETDISVYWQPNPDLSVDENERAIAGIRPWLTNIHVFYWDKKERLPLEQGTADWKRYLRAIAAAEGERYAMLEFVRDNDPQQFLEDARVLKSWIGEIK